MYGDDRQSEIEKLIAIDSAVDRDKRDELAWHGLETGDRVKTPDGWTGFVAEKEPDQLRVYVESWKRGATYRASSLEVLE